MFAHLAQSGLPSGRLAVRERGILERDDQGGDEEQEHEARGDDSGTDHVDLPPSLACTR